MGILAGLGFDPAKGTVMLVGAPDSVLAEAGAMKPRPSFAPSLLTAEPTDRLVWWPERAHFNATMFARLKWLLETSAGKGWLITDAGDEDTLTEAELRSACSQVGVTVRWALTSTDGVGVVEVGASG